MKVNVRISKEGEVYVISGIHIGGFLLNKNKKPNKCECIDLQKPHITSDLDLDFARTLKPLNANSETAKETLARLKEFGWNIEGTTRLNSVFRIW